MQIKREYMDKLPGVRITNQRRLLLDILTKARGHLDAEELYRLAKVKDQHISLSTVYRNLKLFKDTGMVKERHFAEEHHHYEVNPSSEHQHLVCIECGKVVEFNFPQVTEVATKIGLKRGFMVTQVALSIEGYCPTCKAAVET
jgi:Fur family ferric uptake transcriptional regulator